MDDEQDDAKASEDTSGSRRLAVDEDASFERVRRLIRGAFGEPESAYVEMSADDIRALAANRGR